MVGFGSCVIKEIEGFEMVLKKVEKIEKKIISVTSMWFFSNFRFIEDSVKIERVAQKGFYSNERSFFRTEHTSTLSLLCLGSTLA